MQHENGWMKPTKMLQQLHIGIFVSRTGSWGKSCLLFYCDSFWVSWDPPPSSVPFVFSFSSLVLSWLVLACLVLSCLVLSCLVLSGLLFPSLHFSSLPFFSLLCSSLVFFCLLLFSAVFSCLLWSRLFLSCLALPCLVLPYSFLLLLLSFTMKENSNISG